jgi:hypothetical protein
MAKNLLTAQDCIARFGRPETESHMYLWDVPPELEVGVIPKRLYCNADMVRPLIAAFGNIINRKLIGELKTFDGCFNIRTKRGGSSPSLHSWGVAIDINANWNRMGSKPTLSPELVACFTEAGFDWGGYWATPDGMHFQLAKLP